MHDDTVEIRYLEYSLLWTFAMSNFLFGSSSILVNFSYKSIRYLELHYLELSIFGLFRNCLLEHSNEVFEWIMLLISGIRNLITALTKLFLELCSFFFSNIVQATKCPHWAKTQCKKFRQEMSGFKRSRKWSL